MTRKAADFDQFQVRLPPGMREQIKRSAEESGRSMNAEIIDALREVFPVDPSLEEITDELSVSLYLLQDIQSQISKSGRATGRDLAMALGQLQSINEDLSAIIAQDRVVPVAKLRPDAAQEVEKLLKWYDLPASLFEETVSNLVLMAVARVQKREERLRVRLGEGDSQRIVEIDFPEEAQTEK